MIGMIILVSAEIHYVGDSFEIPTDYEIVNCSVINSTYGEDGLDLNWSGKNILISTSPYSHPDSFSISCWVIKGQEVTEQHYSSGGGSSCSYNTNYDWQCGSWTSCMNGTQTRICNERNNCGSIYGRPKVINNCSEVVIVDNNDTIIDDVVIEDEDLSLWTRFWNWFKGLFGR